DGYGQPDRITMPLKRAGARGEGKWKPISWDQLIKEVTEGGKLFADIGEDQEIEGFLSIHDTETPLNPDEPTLGPKSNQFVLLGGRGDGRTTFGGRFANCFGSINQYGHAST
ncbi:MAG: molybdopterin-dependent oxidoreductase, partial [Ellagibacter isourolithinifaciens]